MQKKQVTSAFEANPGATALDAYLGITEVNKSLLIRVICFL